MSSMSSPTLLPGDFTWTEAFTITALLAASYLALNRYTSIRSKSAPASPSSHERLLPDDKISRTNTPTPPLGDIRVSKILIHPIKSCRGTSVQSARYTPEGLENDRKWCIVDANTNNVLTARDASKMVLITPRIEIDETSPHGGSLVVSFPEDSGCETFSVPLRPNEGVLSGWKTTGNLSLWGQNDIDGYICEALRSSASSRTPSEILTAYFNRSVHLSYKGPRPRPCGPTRTHPQLDATCVYQDGYPLLVMSDESMDEVQAWIKTMQDEGRGGIGEEWRVGKVNVERFRPNIVVSGAGPWAEDGWEEIGIGSSKEDARTGAPGITLVSKCMRCLLPNVSPETGIRDKAVPFKVLMRFRIGLDPADKMKPCVGCNGVPKGEGVVKVGDIVGVRQEVS